MGRCGKSGLDVLLRLKLEATENGIWALGFNASPESEPILWDMFSNKPADAVQSRLQMLRAICAKLGTPEQQETRRERVRPELVQYLKLPKGVADVWNIQHAVELAKDTKDSYYLPHVEALERAFFSLNSNAYKCPGMEDRMDEALATLQESFDNAKLKLSEVDTTVPE